MRCPKCQFDNKEGAKFCKKCGTRLELVCPSCGHPYEEDSLFCEHCGQRLEQVVAEERAVPGAEGERKYVTVLFSDLRDFTPLVESGYVSGRFAYPQLVQRSFFGVQLNPHRLVQIIRASII